MTRLTILAALVFATSASAARAADLPTGTWTLHTGTGKSELVITEVKDGKVKAKMGGVEVTGTWTDGKLTIHQGLGTATEVFLLTEPAEAKGKTKYTLIGVMKQVTAPFPQKRFSEPVTETVVGAWYAQIIADTPVPTGEIKATVRGVLVQDGADVYVSVKRKTGSGVEETRIYVEAEGEWKTLQQELAPLYGKEVIVTAGIAQFSKGQRKSIPEGTLYFLGKFEPKLANVPK